MTHKNLIVWQQGIALVKCIYLLTQQFPQSELFGLTNQMRRCAVSIPSNIAEGYGRNSEKELTRFLSIASGSASELETQLIIAQNLGFITQSEYQNAIFELTSIIKILSSLIKKHKENAQPS